MRGHRLERVARARRQRALYLGVAGDARTRRVLLQVRFLAEIVDAIDRSHVDVAHVDTLQHAQRDCAAGCSASPYLAIELLLRANTFASNRQYDVAGLNACAIGGPFRRDSSNDESALHFFSRNAKPWTRRTGSPAVCDEGRPNRL